MASDSDFPRIMLKPLTGVQLEQYVADLARLRIEVFRDYPYLYDGSAAYEEKYLRTYVDSPDSVLIAAFHGDQLVGASTGLPMDHETDNIKEPVAAAGFPSSEVFYFGESVLQRSYRGQGIGVGFFREREAHARRLGRFRYCMFCGVVRADDDLRRPAGHVPLDGFWQRRGYHKVPGLVCRIAWTELGETEETPKVLQFWVRALD